MWQRILTFPKRKPYATNIGVATVKTALADYLVQMYLEGKKEYDVKRGAVFAGFGCAYLGFVQWHLYVTLFSRICPNCLTFANLPWAQKFPITAANKAGWIDVCKQTFLDNFVHYTFLYFPVFYLFKNTFQKEPGKEHIKNPVMGAIQQYSQNFWKDNTAMWMLWIPADFLIYTVPVWLRLPLNHGVSLAWIMILSALRGETSDAAAVVDEKLIDEL